MTKLLVILYEDERSTESSYLEAASGFVESDKKKINFRQVRGTKCSSLLARLRLCKLLLI